MLEAKIPEFICSPCCRTVHSFYEFKKTCLENYSRLLQYTQKLQGSIDSRGQKFSEVQIQMKKLNLLMGQDVDSKFYVEKEIEDSLKEQYQKIDKIDIKEEFSSKFIELPNQMHNEELVREQEQELNSELKIKVDDKVLLQSLENREEKSVAFDTFYTEENITAPDNEEDEFNKKHINFKRVSANEQGNTSGSSCEDDNRLMVDEANFNANSDNVNITCNNKNTGRGEFKRTNYKCTVCNKYFLKQRYLTIHMKIHNNIRDFNCQICGRGFVQRTSLIRHLKIHTRRKEVSVPLNEHEEVQINNRELIGEQEQEENNELKIKVEEEVLLPIKEHEELQHQMNNRELIEEKEQEVNNALKFKMDEVSVPLNEHKKMQVQINNRELIGEQEQEMNYEIKIEVEEEVLLPIKENDELQHQMNNRYLIGEKEQELNNALKIKVEEEVLLTMKKHEELQHQMNNRELIEEKEQEVNHELKIEMDNDGILQSLGKHEEKPVAFDIVYIMENMTAPENTQEDEYNKKHINYERVSANEQGCTSRSSCENYNRLVVDASVFTVDTDNVNCNNRNEGKRELTNTNFKCTVCNKYYLKQRNLDEHLKIHNNIKNFKCQICGKDFVQRKSLIRHLKMHAGIKAFKCILCDRNFSQKGTLETHMNMHVGIRDFECGFCDKKFILKSHLKVHMDRHLKKICDEKPEQNTTLFTTKKMKQLKCSVCERKFIRQDTLDKHMRVHAGIIFFECSICKLKFANNIKLVEHMQNHTSERSCVPTEFVLGLE